MSFEAGQKSGFPKAELDENANPNVGFFKRTRVAKQSVWILQEFRILQLCDTDFARVSHFATLSVWNLQEFRIFHI